MRKNLMYSTLVGLCSMVMFSCSAEMDVDLNNDNADKESQAIAILYQHQVSDDYNPDNDTRLRAVFSGNVDKAYCLCELQEAKDAYIGENGRLAYMQYVVENGKEMDIDVETSSSDSIFVGLMGMNEITVVTVSKSGQMQAFATQFKGLTWHDVCTGTYYLSPKLMPNVGFPATAISDVKLQQEDEDPCLYRLASLYKSGYHVKFNKLEDYEAEDEGGKYNFIRIPRQKIGFTLGSYGALSYQDIGYWQGDDGFVLSGGFESGMYEDNSCFFYVALCAETACVGYDYEYFVPDAE